MGITTLNVRGENGSGYSVVIGYGLLRSDLPRFVRERGVTRTVIITHDTLVEQYGNPLAASLPGGAVIEFPAGERYKTLDTVQTIYKRLIEADADRSTLIIALGGGVVGDVAGFAAATFMRGLPFIQAPTSLLAMVDASIGGKVGVDLPQGKNLVGAFKDPLAVFADLSTLFTLPDEEYRCGLAEIIKAALIGDVELLTEGPIVPKDAPTLRQMVTRAVQVKVKIVEQDRFETGIRAHLNLGHTFAHALEQVSGYKWRHGEAVAVGLVCASELSERLGLTKPGLRSLVERILSIEHLPVRYAEFETDELIDAMRRDKKWRDGRAQFVLLKNFGEPVVRDDVPLDLVRQVLHELKEEST